MILEIARFFADVAEFDATRSRYVIRGVMGLDEFHTGYPGTAPNGIDNNAYIPSDGAPAVRIAR